MQTLIVSTRCTLSAFFFFNDTATTEIYTLSLHDALPISVSEPLYRAVADLARREGWPLAMHLAESHAERCIARDRKSTRLNSSHSQISYAVFCLKKKKSNLHHDDPERRSYRPAVEDPHTR